MYLAPTLGVFVWGGMAGRKTKLNDKVQSALVKLIEKGVSIEDACQHVGIGERTFYDWITRGEDGEKEFLQFSQAVTRARVDAKIVAIDTIRTAMSPFTQKITKTETFTETRLTSKGEPYEYKRETVTKTLTTTQGEWRAAIDYLKRRYPGEWSEKLSIVIEAGISPDLINEVIRSLVEAEADPEVVFRRLVEQGKERARIRSGG